MKRKASGTVPSKKTLRAFQRTEHVMLPLLDLFATVDDVMTEAGAFEPEHIHKSLGRVYRSWLDTREALDPEFDRDRFRHDMKGRPRSTLTPLGRKRPVQEARKSSTETTQISEKSRRESAKNEKRSAKKSVQGARSGTPASGGRLPKKRSSESGVGSPTKREGASLGGSRKKGTRRSRLAKD